jgi:hypothetical protein
MSHWMQVQAPQTKSWRLKWQFFSFKLNQIKFYFIYLFIYIYFNNFYVIFFIIKKGEGSNFKDKALK